MFRNSSVIYIMYEHQWRGETLLIGRNNDSVSVREQHADIYHMVMKIEGLSKEGHMDNHGAMTVYLYSYLYRLRFCN